MSTGGRSPVDKDNGNRFRVSTGRGRILGATHAQFCQLGPPCRLGGPCQLGAPCILRASELQGVLFILESHSAGLVVARMGQHSLCCFTSIRTNLPQSESDWGGFSLKVRTVAHDLAQGKKGPMRSSTSSSRGEQPRRPLPLALRPSLPIPPPGCSSRGQLVGRGYRWPTQRLLKAYYS